MLEAIEELTPQQESALDTLVSAFPIQHGEISISLEIYNGAWTKVTVSPKRRILRNKQHTTAS